MDKNEVLELLKAVTYPGFSRDIVSFGMVSDISITGKTVTVQLRLATQKTDKKRAVAEAVRSTLVSTDAFDSIEVEFIEDKQRSQAPVPPSPGGALSRSELTGVKHIIAIASGKGGVGKSTVAVNIALALSQSGLRVGLLDLDIYGPSLPIILGINEYPKITPEKKLIPLLKFGMKVMSFGFISGNETPVIWRGPLVARMTEQFFNDVHWGDLDYLILDLPPGTGDVQLTLTQKFRITGAIIVTTPQDIALADVRKGADMFQKVQTPVLGVVENMSGLEIRGTVSGVEKNVLDKISMKMKMDNGDESVYPDENGRFTLKVDIFKRGGGSNESHRLGVPLMGEIPISPELVTATDAGIPTMVSHPDSPVAAIFKSITKQITAQYKP